MKAFSVAVFLTIVIFSNSSVHAQVARLTSSTVSEQNISEVDRSSLAKLRSAPAVAGVEIQKLNPAAFSGNYISITLNGVDHTYTKQAIESPPDGSTVWSGMELGGNGAMPGGAIFNLKGGKIWGTVQANGDIYEIQPLGAAAHSITHKSTAKFHIKDDGPMDRVEKRPIGSLNDSVPMGALVSGVHATPAVVANPPVRILVAYSAHALSYFGNSLDSLTASVNTAIAQINQANINSTVPFRAQLAGIIAVTYNGPYDVESALAAFKVMPAVLAAHDAYQADLMVMLESVPATADAGVSAAINAPPNNAFAAVGTLYMTSNQSFVHEVGHLMGADHDQQDTQSDVFHMGHGFWSWKQNDIGSNLSYCGHTIMSYAIESVAGGVGLTTLGQAPDCVTDPRIPYWSNPQLYMQLPQSGYSVYWGTVGTNDNAQLLANQGAIFTNYHLTLLNGGGGGRVPTNPVNCKANPQACAATGIPTD